MALSLFPFPSILFFSSKYCFPFLLFKNGYFFYLKIDIFYFLLFSRDVITKLIMVEPRLLEVEYNWNIAIKITYPLPEMKLSVSGKSLSLNVNITSWAQLFIGIESIRSCDGYQKYIGKYRYNNIRNLSRIAKKRGYQLFYFSVSITVIEIKLKYCEYGWQMTFSPH